MKFQISRVIFGYCPCCMRKTIFVANDCWFRDHLHCIWCKSIPRQRAIMKVLQERVVNFKSVKIHESSPSGPTFKYLQERCSEYSFSYFFPEKKLGVFLEGGGVNQNLESMTFDSESFDVFITQDVFEHINNPDKAFNEIKRVLKKGGIHVFTIPLYPFQATRTRIKSMASGELVNILPPLYHKNPIDSNGSLVTYDYGYDIKEFIYDISKMETEIIEFKNSNKNFSNGLEGNFLEVLVSKKTD